MSRRKNNPPVLISHLTLQGVLSFGKVVELDLHPLNVLIGPNGSGKSNLLNVIDLLHHAPKKLATPIRNSGGGANEWIWKGDASGGATIKVDLKPPVGSQIKLLRHFIQFSEIDSRFTVTGESIHYTKDANRSMRLYRYDRDNQAMADLGRKKIKHETIASDESILSQRTDPDLYPELNYMAESYGRIALYREWTFGRKSALRKSQPADMPSDRLAENLSNLGLVLNRLRSKPSAKRKIVELLRDLYEGLDDFDVRVQGGMVEVFLTEGDFTIPASRLSDGTLRYLCLLAILCDPEPPPLICIEEPELGLHPDMTATIAGLLVEASERTQLVVTTHSEILVDAMTERPESVVVFDKHEGSTVAKRLESTKEMKAWLNKYRLGQLWASGTIGGNRW